MRDNLLKLKDVPNARFLNSKHPKWIGLTFPMILAVPTNLSMDPTTYISETSSYPPPEVPDPDIHSRAATNEAAAAQQLCAVVLIGITHQQCETGRNFMELLYPNGPVWIQKWRRNMECSPPKMFGENLFIDFPDQEFAELIELQELNSPQNPVLFF